MAVLSNDDIITALIRREGGERYTCVEGDHGGATRFGITQVTLSTWRGVNCMPADVAALTEAEARAIYQGRFIRFHGTREAPHGRPGFDQVTDMALRDLLVDWGVTSGPGVPVKALQRALAFTPSAVDGIIGPITAAAANAGNVGALYASVLAQRKSFYRDVAADDPSQQKFLEGWLNRCKEFDLCHP